MRTPGLFSDFILEELERINWTQMSDQLDDIRQALITAMAILLSVNLETSLGKLLKICLEAKVSQETAVKNPFEMATEIMDVQHGGTKDIYDWLDEIIQADGNISESEAVALKQCWASSERFSRFIDQELAEINI